MSQHSSPPEMHSGGYADRVAHHAHHSGGGYAHWIRTGSALAPLIIGECVKDPEKRWRYIRITSVAMAFISEGVHAHRVEQQRKDRDHERRF
jgi:hypothetical protein